MSQELSPTGVYSSDFTFYTDAGSSVAAVLSNRTTTDTFLWDDTPGVLALTANSAIDGDFGTAYIELALQDPGGITADYYSVRVYVKSMVYDSFLGPMAEGVLSFLDQYTWAWLGVKVQDAETSDIEVYYPTDRNIEYADSSGSSWYNDNVLELDNEGSQLPAVSGAGMIPIQYHDFEENPLYDRPWTLDEVKHMRLYGEFGWSSSIFSYLAYSTPPLALGLAQYYVEIFPAEYTPDITPTGSFIVRPDGDWAVDGWVNESDDDGALFTSLNETTYLSDQAESYIKSNDSGAIYFACTFTDAPAWAMDTTYEIRPWLILQTSMFIPGDFFWNVQPASEQWETLEMASIMYYWCNRSEVLPTVYESGDPWTLDSINALVGVVTCEPEEQLNISQFAVLCVPTSDVVFEVGESFDMLGWLATGGGFQALLGIIGFAGVIGTPLIAVYMTRSGQGTAYSIFAAILAMSLFIAFLWAGLAGHWG
jgi:hypothetical protein